MRNRHGDMYSFERVRDNTYKIVGDLKYWRYGGQEHAPNIDYNDLGFVDPSGGPFISKGYKIEGLSVSRIFVENDNIYFDVS